MSSTYPHIRAQYAQRKFDWLKDDIFAVLVDEAYSPSKTDRYLTDIPYGAIITSPVELQGKCVVGDAMGANNIVFRQVAQGHCVRGIVLYTDELVLVAFVNESRGLPLFTYGGDVIVVWEKGPNRIFPRKALQENDNPL